MLVDNLSKFKGSKIAVLRGCDKNRSEWALEQGGRGTVRRDQEAVVRCFLGANRPSPLPAWDTSSYSIAAVILKGCFKTLSHSRSRHRGTTRSG